MTTEELVVAAMADDIDAFSQLVTRYQAMAFTYALATGTITWRRTRRSKRFL